MHPLSSLSRHHFLALGAGSLLSRPALSASPDPRAAAFARQQAHHPWLSGYQNAPLHGYGPLAISLPATWPKQVSGTLYRNGPALHQFAGQRYHHWFDGDGMVHRFHIANGTLHYHARFVETAKLTAERAAGKRLRAGFGTYYPGPPTRHPDDLNSANISVLWHNQKLFALWEAGSPYEIDPGTLATKGRHRWQDGHYLPFTAHPKVDENGHLWAIGYSNVGPNRLFLYHIGLTGDLRQQHALAVDNLPPVHDFVLTKDFLVIPLPPLSFNPATAAETAYIDSHIWQGDKATRILIVDSADFSKTKIVETDPWWVFHYAGGWQDADGTIRLQAIQYPNTDIIYGPLRDVMRGHATASKPGDALPVEITISPGGKVNGTAMADLVGEFPVRPEASATGRYDDFCVLTAKLQDQRPQFTGIARIDLNNGVADSFEFGNQVSVEEHLWLPGKRGAPGWLIGIILDHQQQHSALCLFDAGNLSDGPRSRIELPHIIPLGLHGCFI